MEETTTKSFMQPKTIAELLPSLSGILSKDAMQTLTAKKAPRPTMAITRTTEKAVVRPLTIAEMRADLIALRPPRMFAKPENSTKKRNWNSSVKLDYKTKSCTGMGQLKENPVRKTLNFQAKATPKTRQTMISHVSETVKFQKPEARPKKAAVTQSNHVRISGIYKIQETPVQNNKLVKNRMSIANKENNFNRMNQKVNGKKVNETPKTFKQKKIIKAITPQTNISFKSNDDSFLQKEAEINKIEEKSRAVAEERVLENIAEVSPLVSTPFKEYRNLQQFFNNSNENEMDNSNIYNDNTIMSFDNIPKGNKRDESVIVSLCDLLNKASMNETQKQTGSNNTELNDLLEFEKQTQESIKMIDSGIKMLINIKESHIKSLEHVQRLINEKKNNNVDVVEKKIDNKEIDMDKTLVEVNQNSETMNEERLSLEMSPVCRPSVIKMKSPSYKIPKKNLCLRKKVFHKSMPNVASKTPTKEADKALDMYLQMKQNMNFLNTPVVKHQALEQADTPAVTSHNLQKQLDKLFNCS
ncbi:GATA zinc finger domain-containing protein 8-like [Aricia agestis]|uniref:GATA zinc finger domain-containing protein 8-like n=1 Tax=Aricia agestis TaxID=91739 RepID=UPI001C20C01F|nr:GATA zinc finger domain-containing protein 8-like [Aricia agestis]